MRFHLRTLLILLAVGPPLLAWLWPRPLGPIPIATMRPGETAEVDLIHVHYNTSQVIEQVIFWSRYPDGELHIREWRLGPGSVKNIRIAHSGNEGCECRWIEHGVERHVRSPAFHESKSADDPEILDRDKLPKHKRDPLWHWADQ